MDGGRMNLKWWIQEFDNSRHFELDFYFNELILIYLDKNFNEILKVLTSEDSPISNKLLALAFFAKRNETEREKNKNVSIQKISDNQN